MKIKYCGNFIKFSILYQILIRYPNRTLSNTTRSWKKYNTDAANETEYTKKKNEIMKMKETQLLASSMVYGGSGCIIN